jgi:hypothetical protein
MPAPGSSEQPGGEHGAVGYYVYGIVPGDVETNGDVQGVGEPPARVELVRHRDIAALISEIDTSQPLGRPNDLMVHQQLLDAASGEAPVLPVRFGAVVASREAVTDELLVPHYEEFLAALSNLEEAAEYVIKGRYVEDAVLQDVLSENPEAARLRDQIRAAGNEDATRNDRIRLGELISDAVSARREADTRAAADAVASYCIATNVREPTHELDAINLALLIKTPSQPELEKAVDKFAREREGQMNIRLLGPMAPYDFVVTTEPEN